MANGRDTRAALGDIFAGLAGGPGAVTQRAQLRENIRGRRRQEQQAQETQDRLGRLSDPNSEESMAARQEAARRLDAAGRIFNQPLAPEAIDGFLSGLSADDLSKREGQEFRIAAELAKQSQRAQKLEADTVAKAAARPAPTPGQQAVDREFAKEFSSFIAAGGAADVEKNLKQLEDAKGILKSGKNVTGPAIGRAPLQEIFNPAAVDLREQVEEVVQRNLRLILGAQFTEKEGTRLIERAFNPKLDEKVNLKRINRLIDQIRSAARAKSAAADFFQKNGTLQGFTGEIPSFADFDKPQELTDDELDEEIARERAEIERLNRGGRP